MGQLSLTVLRLGFLVLLWALVLSAIGVLRSDLYGTRITSRGRGLRARKRAADMASKVSAPLRSSTGVRTGSIATHAPAVAHLAVTSGKLKGTIVPLGTSAVLIGRAPTCTVVIDDDYLSAKHCRIFPEGQQWFVEDLGSTNGTYLGNQKVEDPVPFALGEKIRMGATTLELRS